MSPRGYPYVLELFLRQDTCCLFCHNREKISVEVRQLRKEVDLLKRQLRGDDNLETVDNSRQDDSSRSEDSNRSEDSIRSVERDRKNSNEGFIQLKNGARAKVKETVDSAITVNDRKEILYDEVGDEPSFSLVGDSLIRGQDSKFCKDRKRKRTNRCYPGQKIEEITDKVDYLVENSPEDTTFVTLVGTNNLLSDDIYTILEKYRRMIREFTNNRCTVAVCSTIPL